MRLGRTLVLRFALVSVSLLLATALPARGAVARLDQQVVMSRCQVPHIPVGDGSFRTYAVSDVLPSETGAAVLVRACEREVSYFDVGSLKLIRQRVYCPNEWAVVSQNGGYIAVMSRVEQRETNRIVETLRMEDWTGKVLWQTDKVMRSGFEPTPTGGLVAYPVPDPNSMTDPVPGESRVLPVPRAHGLLIYDDRGSLLLEGVDYREVQGGYTGSVSPDGRFLALGFRCMPSNTEGEYPGLSNDRACLVLYDLHSGTEVWRRYYDGTHAGPISVGPRAERVLCFLTKGVLMREISQRFILLDSEGSQISEGQIGASGTPVHVGRPILSPDGEFCVYIVGDSRAYSISTEDGARLWEFGLPRDAHSLGCLQVNNDGDALLVVASRAGTPGRYERDLLAVDGNGIVTRRLDTDSIRTGGTVYAGGTSGDGSSLWLVQGDSIVLYSLESE